MPSKSARESIKSKFAYNNVSKIVDWQPILDTKSVNLYSWSAHVIFINEFNSQHIRYLDLFNDIASQGARSCINVLTFDGLKNTMKRLSQDTTNNTDIASLPSDLRIYPVACEEAMQYVSKNKDIPPPLLARLIKLEILRMKYIHIHVTEKKRVLNIDVDNDFSDMLSEQKSFKLPSVKMSKVANLEASEVKKGTSTKLSKRGEEWKMREDIVDSPKGGPSLYVILSQFYNPEVIPELIKLDIPVIGIIQMRREDDVLDDLNDIKTSKNKSIVQHDNIVNDNKPHYTGGMIHRIQDIYHFWYKYSKLIKNPEFYSKLENSAFVTFKTPIFKWDNKSGVPEDDEKMLYDDICYAVYEIEDILRQYENYMKHMKILKIEARRLKKLEDFEIYNGMINLVPNECITVPIILNCMLEQVTNLQALHDSTDEESSSLNEQSTISRVSSIRPPTRDYHGKIKTKFIRIFNRIAKENQTLLRDDHPEYNKVKPFTVEYGNDIKFKSFHLEHINLEDITLNVLYYHVLPTLWRRISFIPEEDAIFYNCHMTKILSETPNKVVTKDAIWHYIHLKVLEKMYCTSTTKLTDDTDSKSLLSNLLEEQPRSSLIGKQFSLGSVEKLTPLHRDHRIDAMSLNDILFSNDLAKLFTRLNESSNVVSMADYKFYNSFNVSVMLQQLYNASLSFNCIDFHHFPFTDVLILHFHNSYPKEGFVKDDWEVFLRSFVCFRDFVNYVYNENQEWIKKQEEKYKNQCKQEEKNEEIRINLQKANEALLKMDPDTNFHESLTIIPVESDYLLPGSIKEQIYKKKEETVNTLTSGRNKASADSKKKKEKSTVSSGRKNQNVQQQLELTLFPPYPPESPYHRVYLPVETAEAGDHYDFIGYDLGSNRVQLSGCTQYVYSGDQSFIKVETTQRTYSDEKLLSIELTKHSHALYLYSVASKVAPTNEEFNFHVNVSNGIILSFGVPKLTATIPDETVKTVQSSFIKRSVQSSLSDGFDTGSASTKKLDVVEDDKISSASEQPSSHKKMVRQPSSKVKHIQQPELDNKFQKRMDEEKRLHDYLTKMTQKDVLTPQLVSESELLKTKQEIIAQLEEARSLYFPCYKIHSSKLHTYKYIKRVKPYVTVNIHGILKKIQFRPRKFKGTDTPSAGNMKYHEKWKKLSSTVNAETIPLIFDLRASWPNGLCIKTVSTYFEHTPYYIKQYFIEPEDSFDELSRCFLSNGTILIYRTEGRMKILCADSTIFNCQIDGFKPITLKPDLTKIRNRKNKRMTKKRLHTTTMCYLKDFKEILRNIRIKKHLISGRHSLRVPYSRRMYLRAQKRCYRIATQLYEKQPDLIPIPEYNVLEANGDKLTVRNNKVCGIRSKLLVDIASDLTRNEVYTEREDNTITLLHGDTAMLEVLFPDGTRITTGYEIEDEEICVEFTDDEMQILLVVLHEERILRHALYESDSSSDEDSSSSGTDQQLTFEPFVSVVLTCTFDHPKYSRVSFKNGIDFSAELTMVDDVTVNIDRLGQYVADLDDSTKLSVLMNEIIFEQVTCCNCLTKSRAEINYLPFLQHYDDTTTELEMCYVTNINSIGQEICVDFDGNVLHGQSAVNMEEKEHTCKSYLEKKSICKDDRYFILKRSLNGSEFIHHDEQKKYVTYSLNKKFSSIYSDRNDNEESAFHDDDALRGNAMIVTYALERNYAENWLMPMNKIQPINIKRKDALPSTYYPGGWLSAFPKFEPIRYTCCTDALYQPVQSFTQKLPPAMLRREFLSLEMCCEENMVSGPLLDTSVPVSSFKVKRSIRPYTPIYKQSSAFDFRDRWNKKQSEIEHYRQLLKKRQVPKFFSKEMEVIMFNKSCKKQISSEPFSQTTTNDDVTSSEQDYKIDLVEIAKKWAKHGYARYQPLHKKRMTSSVQTSFVAICDSPKLDAEVNDETPSFCNCQRKSRIPIYKPGPAKHRYKSLSEPALIDLNSITARAFKRHVSDGNTGSRKGKNAVQARKKLADMYGEGVLTVCQYQNWFTKFRSGNFDVEDAPRSGRPVETVKDAIKALVDANPRITTREVGLRPFIQPMTLQLTPRSDSDISNEGKKST